MVGQDNSIVLSRDSTDTPWGFRLQGGQEVNSPLVVQRVFVGGVSEGKLQRGDVVVAIQGHDASRMNHSEAENYIKNSGTQLNMQVRRGGDMRNDWQSSGQSYDQYGGQSGDSYPYSQSYNQSPMRDERGRSNLGAGDDDENYSRSFQDIKKVFAAKPTRDEYSGIRLNVRPGSTSYVPKRPHFTKPSGSMAGALSDPGWVPQNKPYPLSQNRFGPSGPVSPPINRGASENPVSYYSSPPPQANRRPAEKPAWYGSLRSSGGPKTWEVMEQEAIASGGPKPPIQHQREAVHASSYPGGGGGGHSVSSPPVVAHNPKVQSFRYGPSGEQTYEQNGSNNVDTDTAKVAHLQYNTPIGLYSKDNALEALRGQTKGKPGEGTLTVTGESEKKEPFCPPGVQSDLYRMIREEEEYKKRAGDRPAARSAEGNMRRGPARRRSPPRVMEEQHSQRYHQLVNENNDQLDQYLSMPRHTTSFGGEGGRQHQTVSYGMSGSNINVHHGDHGISDF